MYISHNKILFTRFREHVKKMYSLWTCPLRRRTPSNCLAVSGHIDFMQFVFKCFLKWMILKEENNWLKGKKKVPRVR